MLYGLDHPNVLKFHAWCADLPALVTQYWDQRLEKKKVLAPCFAPSESLFPGGYSLPGGHVPFDAACCLWMFYLRSRPSFASWGAESMHIYTVLA